MTYKITNPEWLKGHVVQHDAEILDLDWDQTPVFWQQQILKWAGDKVGSCSLDDLIVAYEQSWTIVPVSDETPSTLLPLSQSKLHPLANVPGSPMLFSTEDFEAIIEAVFPCYQRYCGYTVTDHSKEEQWFDSGSLFVSYKLTTPQWSVETKNAVGVGDSLQSAFDDLLGVEVIADF